MAILKIKNKKIEVNDGDYLTDAAERLGVLVACRDGTCGECIIKVIKGMENLSELTDKEKDFDIKKPYRLACMCKIKKGEVEIEL